MSDPVPAQRQHRTDLGTKVKSDATLILVETDQGLTGMGAALGSPPIVAAIVEHELAPEVLGEDPMFSERIYEKMYNGSRSRPALERGVTQADESRRRGVIMEAIAGVDIAVWDAKAQALGNVPLSTTGAELLFEVFSQRYERGSTIVTSNLPFDEWTGVFGSERLTGALLDRLTHHVHILEMNGDSYRLKQSKQRQRQT